MNFSLNLDLAASTLPFAVDGTEATLVSPIGACTVPLQNDTRKTESDWSTRRAKVSSYLV